MLAAGASCHATRTERSSSRSVKASQSTGYARFVSILFQISEGNMSEVPNSSPAKMFFSFGVFFLPPEPSEQQAQVGEDRSGLMAWPRHVVQISSGLRHMCSGCCNGSCREGLCEMRATQSRGESQRWRLSC